MKKKTDLKYDDLIKVALKCGAKEAKIIDAKTVSTAAWVRIKCHYGCDGYGSSWCCPPHSPEPEETQKIIDCYSKAILIHNKKSGSITKIASKLEREVFLLGYYKAFALGSGPCSLCKECAEEGCRNAEIARPSMESCGIDVFETAHRNGYPIEVVKNYKCPENYYGLVLIE